MIKPRNAAEGERRSRTALRVTLAMALGLAPFFVLRVNLTRSLPRGLYLTIPLVHPRPGQLVTFCPPPWLAPLLLQHYLSTPGFCPGGTVPFAKRLAAIAPYACATPAGLILDGALYSWPVLPATLRLPLYARCGPTSPSCAFVLGEADSIDSRVFGCVPVDSLERRAVPLFTERRQ